MHSHVLEREQTVGRRAARPDPERLLRVLEQFLTADELTGDVRADVDEVVADRFAA